MKKRGFSGFIVLFVVFLVISIPVSIAGAFDEEEYIGVDYVGSEIIEIGKFGRITPFSLSREKGSAGEMDSNLLKNLPLTFLAVTGSILLLSININVLLFFGILAMLPVMVDAVETIEEIEGVVRYISNKEGFEDSELLHSYVCKLDDNGTNYECIAVLSFDMTGYDLESAALKDLEISSENATLTTSSTLNTKIYVITNNWTQLTWNNVFSNIDREVNIGGGNLTLDNSGNNTAYSMFLNNGDLVGDKLLLAVKDIDSTYNVKKITGAKLILGRYDDDDDDDDRINDTSDTCPGTPRGEGVNTLGCSCSQITIESIACPADVCVGENLTVYEDSAEEGCENGVVTGDSSNCEILSSVYNQTCDDDDDDDGDPDDTDCEPLNDSIYHGAAEMCDGVDNDCEPLTEDGSGEIAPTNTIQIGVCQGSRKQCTGGDWYNWYSAENIPNYEGEEVSCADGLNNDCDDEWDFDTLNRGSGSPPKGDVSCPVEIVNISVSNESVCPRNTVIVYCAVNAEEINSVDVYIDSTPCSWVPNGWNGTVASFECDTGTNTNLSRTVKCSVNTSRSYQSGINKSMDITIGGDFCCPQYDYSVYCTYDPACELCPECDNKKYSLGEDRCVKKGECNYSCAWNYGYPKCGAGCDITGGWTDYVCDDYCMGNTLYNRTNISNICHDGDEVDDCTATNDWCELGEPVDCGMTNCSEFYNNTEGTCTNPCDDVGNLTDGTDANCGNCTPVTNSDCNCTLGFVDKNLNMTLDGCECMITNGGIEICDGVDNDCSDLTDDGSGETALNNTNQVGVCAGSKQNCFEGNWTEWYNALNVTGYEANETSCGDGFDNDCDGEKDYDTLDRGNGSSSHGDNDCPVEIIRISVSNESACPEDNVTVYCEINVAGVNSIEAYIDAAQCVPNGWNGNNASFTCNVGNYTGTAKTARCTVNSSISYQTGNDKTQSVTVGGLACCEVYSESGNCNTDVACGWCPMCDESNKYSGYIMDRCVGAGECNYSCKWDVYSPMCGAECDLVNYTTNETDCGECGTKTRTCQDSCFWGEYGECVDPFTNYSNSCDGTDGCDGRISNDMYNMCDLNLSQEKCGVEAECGDNADNDCDGTGTLNNVDYDGDIDSNGWQTGEHGDDDCGVEIIGISVSDSEMCPGDSLVVSCNTNSGSVSSILAYVDAVQCVPNGWNGYNALFTCNAGDYTGAAKIAKCSVNLSISYQVGTDKTESVTVGGLACCDGYGSSGNCSSDGACEWCTQCSGNKYRGSYGNMCVGNGGCSYSCLWGECGAECDSIGGWTNYKCDDYCGGNVLYTREDVNNTCNDGDAVDDCTVTNDVCNLGTPVDCGTANCSALYANTIGTCNNPCGEVGTATDGTDAACGTCTPNPNSDCSCEPGYVDTNGNMGDGCECGITNGGIEICDGIDNDCNHSTVDGSGQTIPDNSNQIGVCAGSKKECSGAAGWTDLYSAVNITGYAASETGANCADGWDNDCDGKKDYDTLDRGRGAATHGDSGCPVEVTAISVSSNTVCPGELFTVDCTSNVADVNSIDAFIGATTCIAIGWIGNNIRFSCNAGAYTGTAKTAKCSVDTSKSYKTGTDKTTSVTVGGTSCCSSYDQTGCGSDASCGWCTKCDGNNKYSGYENRCVANGGCSYTCYRGECGAQCDDTQGGWTDYVCDDYCSGGLFYVRSGITNGCNDERGSDDCTAIDNRCETGTENSCGTSECSALYINTVGTCNNPCDDVGADDDGYDESCGTCTLDPNVDCSCVSGYADTNSNMADGCECGITNGGTEICDGVDNDCDGVLDGSEGLTQDCGTTDEGLCTIGTESCTDGGGWTGCNSVEPATEICDGNDNNCDGTIDEGCDDDGDGYYDKAMTCGTGYTCDDCNDVTGAGAAINPAATEICDNVDNDCNNVIDGITQTCGTGNCAGTQICSSGSFGDCSSKNTNCDECALCDASGGCTVYDDTRDADCGTKTCTGVSCQAYGNGCEDLTYSNKAKQCTGIGTCSDPVCDSPSVFNQHTDGLCIDSGICSGCTRQMEEFDYRCSSPGGSCTRYTVACNDNCLGGTSCVDNGATTTCATTGETCNGVDDNCNSLIDEGVKTTYYRDSEGDDYGVSSDTIQACSRPAGYAALSGDCDDGVSNTNPGAIEVCNGVDDDCDGNVDEGVKTTYYRDSDGDNYGVTSDTTLACTVPTGYAELSGDCNDGDAAINPGATEACDGVDSDCDGVLDGSEGITQPCGTTDVGLCRYGDESCTNAGGWTGCDSVEPTTEVCDGYDRNCDGYKNKNNAGITLTSSTSCGTDACVGTKTKTCSTSGAWRAYGDCSTKNNYAGIKCGKCDASGTPVYDETRDSDCGTKNCDGLDNCYAYGNGCEIRDYDAIQKRCTGLGKCEDPTCSRYLASNQKVDYCDGDWSAYWSCGDDGNLHKYQTCYSVGCSNGACTSTPHANTNNDHFTSCGGRSCVAPKTFNMDAACVPAPPACGATGTACSTNADCCNQRENKCNLLGKCVQRAGCPYIYACSEEDCSYVHDAFAMSFMKSLEEYSYQTYKGNLDYIKITEPFEEETSYINDFRVYGIESDAFFLPEENTGVLHSIDDPQPPYKVEDDSYYFKKQGDYAKIIINARHTGLSIKTLTYLLSNLGANWFEFYDKQFSLPIINKVWRTSINQYNMHILLNGEDVGNIRGKSDIINETGEDFLIYAKVSDDHDYINITLDYIEDWYVINNVTVDFSEDVPYSIKEIETDFLPFNISTNEERIINIKNNSYDNYLFSIKGWYKPYWALKQNQSFEQSTKHLLTEVLPATTLFGSWNYVEKNLESINDIVKE